MTLRDTGTTLGAILRDADDPEGHRDTLEGHHDRFQDVGTTLGDIRMI